MPSPLKTMLHQLMRAALTNPRKPQRTRLPKGLGIGILVDEDLSQVHLQLSRTDVYPSDGEWRTVLACWPEQAFVEHGPVQREKDGKFYLLGRLHRTPDLFVQDPERKSEGEQSL